MPTCFLGQEGMMIIAGLAGESDPASAPNPVLPLRGIAMSSPHISSLIQTDCVYSRVFIGLLHVYCSSL